MLRDAMEQDLDLSHEAASPRLPIEMAHSNQSESEKASRKLVTGSGATYNRSVCFPGIIKAVPDVRNEGRRVEAKVRSGFQWKGLEGIQVT